MTKCDWFPRTHIDTPEVNLALFGHNVLYQVKFTNRNTTGGDDEITSYGLCKFLTQAFLCITRNSQALWFSACSLYCCFQEIAITLANLSWSQWFIYVDHLIAGSQNCHTRVAYYWYICPTQCCQYANFPWSYLCSA